MARNDGSTAAFTPYGYKPAGLENRAYKKKKWVAGLANRYDKAYSAAMEEQKPFCQLGDVFCNLIHFWQLQLYFNNVKRQTDFYKDLYELIRTEPNVKSAPQNQLAFVRRASQIAKTDLTRVLRKVGHFRPVDVTIDDYGEQRFTLTNQLATAAKSRSTSTRATQARPAHTLYLRRQLANL